MNRSVTVKTGNHVSGATMRGKHESDAAPGKLWRLIDWLGSARRHNEAINDEMATLKFEVELLRFANKELRADVAKLIPLAAYALKRKASLAAYEAKRGLG